MKTICRMLSSVLLLVVFGTAGAYELGTHGRLTYQAYKRSTLSDTQFLSDLGIENGKSPFGEAYYDISGSTVMERMSQPFEREKKRMQDGVEPLSLEGWLMRGAIREDDLGQVLGVNAGGDPHDDPYGNFFRVYNHFYDPALDRSLTTIAGVLGQKAPDWAIGSAAVFTQPNTPDAGRRNHFTVFDAREAMYRALTGRDSQGNVVAATETERSKYWATTFRALGDVAHLMQDMGQPQHTRNDAHSGVIGFGDKSAFEAYIDACAKLEKSYDIDGVTVKPLPQLNYSRDPSLPNDYPIPVFTKYSDFWSTRESTSGRGLADYSNRGFFSAGTNLGSKPFALPSNNAANYVPEKVDGRLPAQPGTTINFLRGDVNDYNQNSAPANIRMTTESAFDAFLANTTIPTKTYSLNHYNYDDMANLLIPRAVAYTAGLINYFFRGKLDYVDDPNNAGKYIIKNLGSESIKGSFTLYYDAVDGKRYPVAGDTPTETWSDRTIGANQKLDNLSFSLPTNPAPKDADVYMLVFKGDMGEEKAGNGAVGAVAAKFIGPAGTTDYVAMSMPNPVPYRGVSIGVVDGYAFRDVYTSSGIHGTSYYPGTLITRTLYLNGIQISVGTADGFSDSYGGTAAHQWGVYDNFYLGYGLIQNGAYTMDQMLSGNPSYPPLPTPEPNYGIRTHVMASDGEVLASEIQTSQVVSWGLALYTHRYVPDDVWKGDGYVNMYVDAANNPIDHQLAFIVPEDCIYPIPASPSAAFNSRREAWLKKNSDELIAALKVGFSPNSVVSRPELKSGKFPDAWEYQIKHNVGTWYGIYPRDQYNIFVGRHTRRAIQFGETAFTETVLSDTSAGLVQAGVKVTQRTATLSYTIPVTQPDGATVNEVRSKDITGTLTQTVTQHNDAAGNELGYSRNDTYNNWYIREGQGMPAGVSSVKSSAYMRDRNGAKIGIVINGEVQDGYNADSTNGLPGNPLTYAAYVPPYPKASSTVTATTIPDFISTWHKDAKIEYVPDGVGASNALNDSALYGVTEIDITPVGLIANGAGKAAAGESVGTFSSGEDGTQVEIYGTAVYKFDWQTGALTFKKWNPLLDANGNEVASKIVTLPSGVVWSSSGIGNAIITYKGLHWPDVIEALKLRDADAAKGAFTYSSPGWYELVKAIKAN